MTTEQQAVDRYEVMVEVSTGWSRRFRSLRALVWGAISWGGPVQGYRDAVTVLDGDEIARRWEFDRLDLCEAHATELRRDLRTRSAEDFRARWLDEPDG